MKLNKLIACTTLAVTSPAFLSITSCSKTNLSSKVICDENIKIQFCEQNEDLTVIGLKLSREKAVDISKSYIYYSDFDNKTQLTNDMFNKSLNCESNVLLIDTSIFNLASKIVLVTTTLEIFGNAYAKKYSADFYKNLTYTYHNYYDKAKCPNLHCTSEAEAIVMWAYHPGFEVWNTLLHDGNGSTKALDEATGDVESTMQAPWPDHPYGGVAPASIVGGVKPQDYQYLDSALSHSTSGIKMTVWHGYEYNESELLTFLNKTLNFDLKNGSVQDASKLDLSKLIGKSYVDFGYCATSMCESMATKWAVDCSGMNNAPLLEIEMDEDVKSAYISNTNKKYFDGIFLGYPSEYQILINRKMTLTIKSAEWRNVSGKHILYIRMQGHKQSI